MPSTGFMRGISPKTRPRGHLCRLLLGRWSLISRLSAWRWGEDRALLARTGAESGWRRDVAGPLGDLRLRKVLCRGQTTISGCSGASLYALINSETHQYTGIKGELCDPKFEKNCPRSLPNMNLAQLAT